MGIWKRMEVPKFAIRKVGGYAAWEPNLHTYIPRYLVYITHLRYLKVGKVVF